MLETKEYLTSQELAQFLNVSIKFIRSNSKRIAGYTKIGRLVRYKKSTVLQALNRGEILL